MPVDVDAADLELRRWIRSGDMVVWGQSCAEPQTLTEALVSQRAELGSLLGFPGIPATRTVRPEHGDHLSLLSYCGTGSNRELIRAGMLDVLPCHYSALPALLGQGRHRADVVLVQVAPEDDRGRFSMAAANEYLGAAIDSARVVIAEVNDQAPVTYGDRRLQSKDIDVVVRTSRPLAQMPVRPTSEIAQRIAATVAEQIPDGATLQFGIGAIPEAILGALRGHRHLGIHSGLLNDAAVDLIEAGVVTNRRKSADPGVSIAGVLMGSRRVLDFAHRNPRVELRGTAYTHDHAVLAAQRRFTAINSAIEVDLTGQVNTEVADGTYVGAVGGGTDFLRGAARSADGLPLVALPATAGGRSRIVRELNGPVSTARSDAGVIVTEFGVADLRGVPLRERAERMIAIAHPDHRTALAESEQRNEVLA
ncbi:acetyl-CoA hydrolase/transferase family protein [Nocardia jinanensis]|uniref:Acetyl-CoA hydrolase n=1 Tax=Nocardia jinanensis TaxID=382504 RepID=A0A917RJH5_9NOCA|nr:acetyl-CoA hydrolase/transferase C-terminal domain-containing protein [Nocardia jinanensis]GGL10041.1 acetyl-CoA hydrolase [Nocardia jinanensis]